MAPQYVLRESTRKHKKYMAVFPKNYLRKPTVHFGDRRYAQFRDATGLRLYAHLDHGDADRRRRYYARHGERRTARKYSAKWFAHKYLW